MNDKNKDNKFSNALSCFGENMKKEKLFNQSKVNSLEIKRKKLLSYNDLLLLDTLLFDYILNTIKQQESLDIRDENIIEFKKIILEYKGLLQETKDRFNNTVINLKRKKITVNGIFHEKEIELTDLEKKELSNKSKNNLPIDLYKKIIVNSVTEEDIIKVSEEGKKADWLSYIRPNGRTFKYTVLVESELSRYGLPIGFYTKEGQSIDINSFQNIFYKDPITGKTNTGIYFEVSQRPGELGNGGTNGIIAPGEKPLVVIDYSKNEAYFLNISIKNQISELPSLGVGVG